jgi:hypothetical protein
MPHTSILSELERRRIKAFLKADGEKLSAIRGLATRCRQALPRIEEDLELVRQFLQRYDKERE